MLVAGIDEAGRGSLISRVYTAAVVLPDDFMLMAKEERVVIRDSKKMSLLQRERARAFIETNAIAYHVAFAGREEIDQYNILEATLCAMHRAVSGLCLVPDKLHVDGNVFRPYVDEYGDEVPYQCLIKGDDTDPAIACASILAKTYRDEFISNLVREHPLLEPYGIKTNMGYGTALHLEALKTLGPTAFHRQSFHIKGVRPDLSRRDNPPGRRRWLLHPHGNVKKSEVLL